MALSELLFAGRSPLLVAFFSVGYLFMFLPAVALAFCLAPRRARRMVLLGASYVFYWLVSGTLIAYLLATTLSAHYFGLWLDRLLRGRDEALKALPRDQRKPLRAQWQRKIRGVVALAVVLHVGVLALVKYSGFFLGNVNALMEAVGLSLRLRIPAYLQPLGISFFTLQALSYILDVCRGTQKADDNLPRLALFIAFFPQIVEGPICRYGDTAARLWDVGPMNLDDVKLGLQRILYGAMKKVVIADRLNRMVGALFKTPDAYGGGFVALAAVCYTVQLYMDFSGSMDAVCGTAQMFGVAMPENFQRPFFARTISEFWQRWHITLGAWLRDYLFYPISTSGPMKALTLKARKRLGNHYGPLLAGAAALFLVWLCNGLWHGAGWNYIFFGMYHFALILSGSLAAPLLRAAGDRLRIDGERLPWRIARTLRTCALVVIGELFFRAETLGAGLHMFGRMVSDFSFSAKTAALRELHFDRYDAVIVLVTLAIVFAVSLVNERGASVRAWLKARPTAVRWALLYALIFYILIFGAYGHDYDAVIPLYANY